MGMDKEADEEGDGEAGRMCGEDTASEGTGCRKIMMETQNESWRKTDGEKRGKSVAAEKEKRRLRRTGENEQARAWETDEEKGRNEWK